MPVATTAATTADHSIDMNRRTLHIAGTTVFVLVLLLLLYTLAGFVVAPRVLERYLPGWIDERFGLRLTIGETSFNPYRLGFEASGLRLVEPAGDPVASAARMHAKLDWSSLLRPGWTLAELRIEGLELRLVRQQDGSLQMPFERDDAPADAEQPSAAGSPPPGGEQQSEPKPLQVRHAVVSGSRLTYVDHAIEGSPSLVVAPIDAEFHDVGLNTSEPGRYDIKAGLPDEAGLAAAGSLSLSPFELDGKLELTALDLGTAWPFARDRLRLAEPRGQLAATAAFRYATTADGPLLTIDPFTLQLTGLQLAPADGGRPLIEAETIALRGGQLDLLQRRLMLPEAMLARGQLTVAIGEGGESNWGSMLVPRDRPDEPQPPWHLVARKLGLEGIAVTYANRSGSPLEVTIGSVDGSGSVEFTTGQSPTELRITDAGLQLAKLSAAGGAVREAADTVASAEIAGGHIDIAARTFGADRLVADSAALSLVRSEDGRIGSPLLPASDAADSDSGEPAEADGDASTAWRYGFGQLSLNASRIVYLDRSLAKPASLVLEPVDVRIDSFGALLPQPGRFSLQAGLPERGSAHAEGTLTLDPMRSSGRFQLSDVGADVLWPFLREQLLIAKPAGRIGGSADYRFESAEGGATFALDSLALQVDGLRLAQPRAERPLMTAQRLSIRNGRVDSAARRAELPQVSLSQGAINVASDADGTVNWARLTPDRAPDASSGRKDGDARPWQLAVGALKLDRVAVRYVTRQPDGGLAVEAAAVSGTASVDVNAGPQRAGTRVADAALELSQVSMSRLGEQAADRVAAVSISGGFVDSAAQRIGATAATVRGGELSLVRDPKGRLRTAAFGPFGGDANAAADGRDGDRGARTDRTDRAQDSGWRYRVGTASIDALQVAFADRSFAPPLAYSGRMSAKVGNIDRESDEPMAFEAMLELNSGGAVKAQGSVAQDVSAANATVDVTKLDFSGLHPLLARYATLRLRTGSLAAGVELVYRARQQPSLQASGRFQISDVLIDEEESDERFLAWKTLGTDSFSFTLDPNRLLIEQINVAEPGARILVSKERNLNLPEVIRRNDPKAQAEAQAKSEAAAPAEPQAEAPADGDGGTGFELRIDRIALRDGTVDFGDESLVLPFSTSIESLDGTVLGISTEPGAEAVIKAEGRVEPFGLAKIGGRMLTFDPKRFTDIGVELENLPMPLLSPYTATFAGRKVNSGRLWLDLRYRIVKQELVGDNRIVVRDLSLGERVAAPNALDLPLELAVALLTDEQGRISVQVPVSGELGDPKFDYGALIRAAVTSTIQRVLTSPFRFLANIAGGNRPDDLDGIVFEPGEARLLPQQQERLARIAVALAKRPALALQVRGVYDPQRDSWALRELLVRRAVVEASGAELKPDEAPGPVALDQPAMRDAIERLLVERAGPDAIERIRREFEPQDGDGPDSLYRAMYERLVELQPLDDAAPKMLAARRAQQISDYLTRSQGIDPSRVQLGEIASVTARRADRDSIIVPLGLTATAY